MNRYLATDPLWKSRKEITDISSKLWSAVSQQVGTNLERLNKVQSFTKSCDCRFHFLALSLFVPSFDVTSHAQALIAFSLNISAI